MLPHLIDTSGSCLDSLKEISKEDSELLWHYRRAYCMKHSRALPKVLLAVPKLEPRAIQDMHRLLVEWPSISPVAALELLDARFPDRYETDD
jgi:phosphatidylinositol-4-phosphate 3-kinase